MSARVIASILFCCLISTIFYPYHVHLIGVFLSTLGMVAVGIALSFTLRLR